MVIIDDQYSEYVTVPELPSIKYEKINNSFVTQNFIGSHLRTRYLLSRFCKSRGQVCSITVDGVNDVPILRYSGISLAVVK